MPGAGRKALRYSRLAIFRVGAEGHTVCLPLGLVGAVPLFAKAAAAGVTTLLSWLPMPAAQCAAFDAALWHTFVWAHEGRGPPEGILGRRFLAEQILWLEAFGFGPDDPCLDSASALLERAEKAPAAAPSEVSPPAAPRPSWPPEPADPCLGAPGLRERADEAPVAAPPKVPPPAASRPSWTPLGGAGRALDEQEWPPLGAPPAKRPPESARDSARAADAGGDAIGGDTIITEASALRRPRPQRMPTQGPPGRGNRAPAPPPPGLPKPRPTAPPTRSGSLFAAVETFRVGAEGLLVRLPRPLAASIPLFGRARCAVFPRLQMSAEIAEGLDGALDLVFGADGALREHPDLDGRIAEALCARVRWLGALGFDCKASCVDIALDHVFLHARATGQRSPHLWAIPGEWLGEYWRGQRLAITGTPRLPTAAPEHWCA